MKELQCLDTGVEGSAKEPEEWIEGGGQVAALSRNQMQVVFQGGGLCLTVLNVCDGLGEMRTEN